MDWFSTDYTLIAGKDVDLVRWQQAADDVSLPVNTQAIDDQSGLYDAQGLVLVRPDGVIADVWQDRDVENGQESSKLSTYLPG